MVDKKFCDLCRKEISPIDRTYFISYGEKAVGVASFVMKGHVKKGEICRDCCLEIDVVVQRLKEKK